MPASDDRPGDLERYAVDCALYAARWTEHWAPADPDHDFLDYFEAAVTRNLGLLWGFETIAEDMTERGIVPPTEGEQATLVTDGGEVLLPTDEIVTPMLDEWEHNDGGWSTWIAPDQRFRVHVEMIALEVPADEAALTAFEVRLDDCRNGRPYPIVAKEILRNSHLAVAVAELLASEPDRYADEWNEGTIPKPEEVGYGGE